jgi:hypothetical protein
MKTLILLFSLLCSLNASAATAPDLPMLGSFYLMMRLDPTSVSKTDFANAAVGFKAMLPSSDQTRFQDMMDLINSYHPSTNAYNPQLSLAGTLEFSGVESYSLVHNTFLLTTHSLVEAIVEKYGSSIPNGLNIYELELAIQADPALLAQYGINPSIANSAYRVFLDIDQFTMASDGNGSISIHEMVDYLAMVASATALSAKVRSALISTCGAGLGKLEASLDSFPKLKAYYLTLTATDKNSFMIWLEHSSRRTGYSADPVTGYDLFSTVLTLHKLETILARFDADQNSSLSKLEINSLYPVFKNQLAVKAKVPVDLVLKGVLTYIFKYKTFPTLTQTPFVRWLATYSFSNYSTDRKGILDLLCVNAVFEQANAQTAAICAQ